MRVFGLLGYPLDHSWSPAYFARKFALENNQDDVYRLFPLTDLKSFKDLLEKTENLAGLNVTIPYKVSIINYLDEVDKIALEVGSVNTITINQTQGKFLTKGYNTDILGFERSLIPHLESYHNKALVFGTGGASKAVVYVLKKLGIAYKLVSRKPATPGIFAYNELEKLDVSDFPLIINTTPIGMTAEPGNVLSPAITAKLTAKHLLYDLIYNPLETEFLHSGKEVGTICVNGMEMLQYQADESWKIWNQ